MNYVRADGSLLGLLIFIGAILFQLFAAMRKGKAARPPGPRPPSPAARRPAPDSAPSPRSWRPEPIVVSAPPPPESKLRELFEEPGAPSSPAPPPVVPDDRAAIVAARALEQAEGARDGVRVPAAWSRLRVQGRAEWQRAVILSEVLQPPVALRSEAWTRTAHV